MNPVATIIIANHNYGHYISDAINSAINQTYPSQIVIVDDGSNDNSWKIINQILFKNISYHSTHHSNGIIQNSNEPNSPKRIAIKLSHAMGPSTARNIAIESTLVETDFYFILDADDIIHPNKVNRFLQKFIEFEGIGIVYADYDNWNIHTNNIIREYKEPFSLQRLREECIIHSGAAIRKNALLQVREPNGDFYCRYLRCAEDWDLWLRLSEKFMVAHIAEPLTVMRIHSNNSTYSVNKDIWNQCWSLVQQRLQYRNS